MNQVFHTLTCHISGIVQGVGFRPTITNLANQHGIGGWIQNTTNGVTLQLEGGNPQQLRDFLSMLPDRIPPLAHITSISHAEEGHRTREPSRPFTIRPSETNAATAISIPTDLATCDACLAEIFDPQERRYGYPFTTCTNCGPRYTVVDTMPYDRENTSLAPFPLCDACHREYVTPSDRRFHAESLACPDCGPSLQVLNASGDACQGPSLQLARHALQEGKIVAVMGLGGFLLAVDATNKSAIHNLRIRKKRPHKPLAIMMPDLAHVQACGSVSPTARACLTSPRAPIVILDTTPSCDLPVDLLSPDTSALGVMLPTTPLHHLLLSPLSGDPVPPFRALVMTSGNRHAEPICLTPAEAIDRLNGIADLFLVHNRNINLRCDDSLVAIQGALPQIWRRARGYAPEHLQLPSPLPCTTLAMGADLKNTIALGWESHACLSPHIGDLRNLHTNQAQERLTSQLTAFLGHAPEAVVVDLHPDMESTRQGERLATEWDLPLHRIQHHHAHAAACLAEHGYCEGLALVFDGTGYGPDGTIWGAELLEIANGRSTRLATFAPTPLPGGDAAIRHPVRQLTSRLLHVDSELRSERLRRLSVTAQQQEIWETQCRNGIHAPLTHAAGRLFDSVAALLQLAPDHISYEGQAAIRLEACAQTTPSTPLSLPFDMHHTSDGLLQIDWTPLFDKLLQQPDPAAEAAHWARAFHLAVAEAAYQMVMHATSISTYRHIALTGGVFMNRLLTSLILKMLADEGLTPLIHQSLPPNDAAISFGQLAAIRTGTR